MELKSAHFDKKLTKAHFVVFSKDSKQYGGLFHDGDLREIFHDQTGITISMESAEVLPEWNKMNITLSKRKTISGKLHLKGVKNIKANGEPYFGILKIKEPYEDAKIFGVKGDEKKIILQIWWVKYLSVLDKK